MMGRRAHKPDPFHRRQVEAMAAYGVPEQNIARVVGIDAKTLRKHYREELDTGQETDCISLLSPIRVATALSVTMPVARVCAAACQALSLILQTAA